MVEYVLRLSAREPDKAETESLLFEFAFAGAGQLNHSLTLFSELLKKFGTPEKLAKHVHDNAAMLTALNPNLKVRP